MTLTKLEKAKNSAPSRFNDDETISILNSCYYYVTIMYVCTCRRDSEAKILAQTSLSKIIRILLLKASIQLRWLTRGPRPDFQKVEGEKRDTSKYNE